MTGDLDGGPGGCPAAVLLVPMGRRLLMSWRSFCFPATLAPLSTCSRSLLLHCCTVSSCSAAAAALLLHWSYRRHYLVRAAIRAPLGLGPGGEIRAGTVGQ